MINKLLKTLVHATNMVIQFKSWSGMDYYSPFTFDTAARDQTRESINEFLESVKSHDLAKAEILNIINIRPTNIIIECCDTQLTEIVEIVKRTLPQPPEDANGAEATKSNGEEGGEQIETS
ncbi:hypothetical protein Ahy_A07g034865 [Arachis hypogaea]|uniref:DNA-directed RNA polymerase III subunit RPC9 n=1 Tax=Arachis hypogaea TaxID=3818 RepID=A0A445CCX9_ARAHY|nr:hypothetical protein Ahy_A07g034865 [Arachis hypogaea]